MAIIKKAADQAYGRPTNSGLSGSYNATQQAADKAKLDAAAARPGIPKFESIRAKGGGLAEPYQMKDLSGPGVIDEAGNLRSQYQIKDPGAVKSPWMDQMLQQQAGMQTAALNRGAKQAATGAASAQASLARRGGLSGGAAERLAGAAQEQAALGAQDIYQKGDEQRLGMQIQDMQQERGYQTGLQQQNIGNTLAGVKDIRDYKSGIQQGNIQNALLDVGSKRQFDLGKYTEDMKGWAAGEAAKATEKGGGGTVICTALLDVGLVTPNDQRKASEFRSEVSHETYKAYLRWGTPVANVIRILPVVGYLFRPLVRYWIGDRDLLAVAQYKFFSAFNKLFVKKGASRAVQI